ncbi:MAG: rRNA (guanine966-N2)-methyltransferase [Methylobacteriaceae bacterium]|jgi:16S rRNA (guanine966-N2)-methyltransferase|nr:rRNA (guanine966-N2)-methyltransferase [Methylobacteriaceae bacterium]
MRITGGRFGGRVLKAPASRAVRPSADRLRESLFNVLTHRPGDPIEGTDVIDLFAGTGALGFEALSRGASHALFVDNGAEARALLRANVEALGVGGVTRIFRRDATRLGDAPEPARFRLAFLDPPYGQGLALPALCALRDGAWLGPGALAIVEESADAVLELPERFTFEERRVYGDTQIVFAAFTAADL